MLPVKEEEIWADIPDYLGYYQVSNLGRVRSLQRKSIRKSGIALYRSQLMRIHYNGIHSRVYFEVNDRRSCKTVARLVAQAFIPCPDPTFKVRHMDGDLLNNHVSNLYWVNYFPSKHKINRRVAQYTVDGEFLCEWETAQIAANMVNGDVQKLCSGLRGEQKTSFYQGFLWSYMPEKFGLEE